MSTDQKMITTNNKPLP